MQVRVQVQIQHYTPGRACIHAHRNGNVTQEVRTIGIGISIGVIWIGWLEDCTDTTVQQSLDFVPEEQYLPITPTVRDECGL